MLVHGLTVLLIITFCSPFASFCVLRVVSLRHFPRVFVKMSGDVSVAIVAAVSFTAHFIHALDIFILHSLVWFWNPTRKTGFQKNFDFQKFLFKNFDSKFWFKNSIQKFRFSTLLMVSTVPCQYCIFFQSEGHFRLTSTSFWWNRYKFGPIWLIIFKFYSRLTDGPTT